jgi:hypothetical protein
MTTKPQVKVHEITMINKDLLSEHKMNSNRQSRHMHTELRESIRKNGFDEALIVVPKPDGEKGYEIISGNHRFRAGKAEGMREFPAVIRDDWDEVTAQIQLVRRNYVRGAIDRDAFTIAVNTLAAEEAIEVEAIQAAMGFEDTDVFLEYYKEENERIEQAQKAAAQHKVSKNPQIQMIDDLGLILSAIFEQFGGTVPYSFLVFPAGGKNHMFVAATPALVNNLSKVAEYCVGNHLDINVVLGGLIIIGMDQSKMFGDQEVDVDSLVDKGSAGLKEGPLEFNKIEA